MATLLKWLLPSLLTVFFVVSISYASSVQNVASHTTSEVTVMEESIQLGNLRHAIDSGADFDQAMVSQDDLLTILTKKVLLAQKNHPYDIEIEFAFFDANGEVTNEDSTIRSIQFNLNYFDQDGEITGSSVKHVEIDQLQGGN